MGIIIDIEGPPAVGKTTLINTILKLYNKEYISIQEVLDFEKPQIKTPSTKAEFLEKQIWFINKSFSRYENARKIKAQNVLIDVGIIDTLLITKFFPKIFNKDFDVFTDIIPFLCEKNNTNNFPDLVVYLYAGIDTLRKRKNSDRETSRTHFCENIQFFSFKKDFYFRLNECCGNSVIIFNNDDIDVHIQTNMVITGINYFIQKECNRLTIQKVINLLEEM